MHYRDNSLIVIVNSVFEVQLGQHLSSHYGRESSLETCEGRSDGSQKEHSEMVTATDCGCCLMGQTRKIVQAK